jgi:hypothetical protein
MQVPIAPWRFALAGQALPLFDERDPVALLPRTGTAGDGART